MNCTSLALGGCVRASLSFGSAHHEVLPIWSCRGGMGGGVLGGGMGRNSGQYGEQCDLCLLI